MMFRSRPSELRVMTEHSENNPKHKATSEHKPCDRGEIFMKVVNDMMLQNINGVVRASA